MKQIQGFKNKTVIVIGGAAGIGLYGGCQYLAPVSSYLPSRENAFDQAQT